MSPGNLRPPQKVEVLTEERDVARSHEEELFAKLTERTEDLEALQESYVSLTDRYDLGSGHVGCLCVIDHGFATLAPPCSGINSS